MNDPIKQNKERIKELKQLGQDTKQPALPWRHSPFKDFRWHGLHAVCRTILLNS